MKKILIVILCRLGAVMGSEVVDPLIVSSAGKGYIVILGMYKNYRRGV